jgi:hypothetical protein
MYMSLLLILTYSFSSAFGHSETWCLGSATGFRGRVGEDSLRKTHDNGCLVSVKWAR